MKNILKLKKRFLSLMLMVLVALGFSSCLEDYLNKAPDSGLDEKEVFSKYANYKSFLYSIYYGGDSNNSSNTFNLKCHYPLQFVLWDQKYSTEALTDMCDMVRMQYSQPPKRGVNSELLANQIGYYKDRAKIKASWKIIRICNKAIQNIDMVQNLKVQERNDFLGQAHFVRAFCHFELFRFYGSMPYLDKALGAEDEWDIARLSTYDMIMRIAGDFEAAAGFFKNAGKMRRDPMSGAGHLNDADQDKPNGVAAKAFKARALLYLASPLNNPSNNEDYWKDAAVAAWEAIDVAIANGYALLSLADYTKNFYGVKYSNEQIWAHSPGSKSAGSGELETFICTAFSGQANASGQCPTENFVSKFETLGGYSIETDAERQEAIAAGEYNEQDPYAKRDPRFDMTVIYNQKPLNGYGNASMYITEDGKKPAESLIPDTPIDRFSRTGYYECKRTGSLAKKSSVTNLLLTDPIIRLAELYLNYAEAANEAYGPNGSAPGATLSALQALNVVRERVGMPEVRDTYTDNKDNLRPRIKNERIIELSFEGFHYYCDIRRWKDAPTIMSGKLYGIQAVKLTTPNPTVYPTGFKYTKVALSDDRQVAWRNGMYYVPIPKFELDRMMNYKPNEAW